jgi:hypothetical protein
MMPRLLLLSLALVAASAAAQTPDAALHVRRADQTLQDYLFRVNVNGGAVFGGAYNGDPSGAAIPVEGQGARMMWYPEKAAFRAGEVRSGVFLYEDTPGFPTTTGGTVWDAANVGDYSTAFGLSSRASGDYAFAAGLGSVAANVSSVAMGEANTASGAASVALGYHAHTNTRQGSFVFSDRSSADLVRAGSNHQATFRTACGFRIFTSSNLATGVAIGGSAVTNVGGCPTSYFGQSNTMIATSTGAYLSTAGVWTNVSDRNKKHLLQAVDGEQVLAGVRRLPVSTWSYRVDADGVRHIGPMAQDFHAAFGLGGEDSTHIATVDADGVALAAVQALEARTRALADENAALRARLDALEAGARAPAQAALPVAGVLVLLGLAGVGTYRRRSGTRAGR